jgi:hypothetical protein
MSLPLRSAFAAALVLLSLPAAAQPAPVAAAPGRLFGETWRGTLLVGLSHLSDQDGLAARVDLDTDLVPLAPRAVIGAVLSLGFSRWSSASTTILMPGYSTELASAANLVDLVPAFRVTIATARPLSFHADSGLGLSYSFGSATTRTVTPTGTVSASASASGLGAVLRFAGGGAYEVKPGLKLGADLGLDIHFGETRGTAVTVLATAAYRL